MSIRRLQRIVSFKYPDGSEELVFIGEDSIGEPERYSVSIPSSIIKDISKARAEAKKDVTPDAVGMGIQRIGE